jgi:hypothetical protein
MHSRHDPKDKAPQADPDFDSTDSGWDPYVASLLAHDAQPRDSAGEDDEDGTPVMSLSRGRAPQR